ncbi:MAG: DUF748 domain-containing protein [Candidatus Omnitrophica bacterium]|nr:DUF748 domain-containing protein [Candidatus Omnitrophota bacterium]
MKKIYKFLLWLTAIFSIVFVLANITLSLFAKQIVVKQIEQNIKLHTALDKISVGLPFSIKLTKLSIGDLFKADEIRVSPNILGFFTGKIVLNGIILVNPVVNLERSGDGSLNLPKLEQKGAQKAPPVYLVGLNIRNGKIVFTDKKVEASGYRVVLDKLSAHVSKVMLPPTSLKANFKLSTDVLGSDNQKLGSIGLSGWIDFGPKDMDAVLDIKDLDLVYFSPYYGNLISRKKLLTAKLNLDATFKARDNNLNILTDFKLSNLTYAQEESVEGRLPGLDLTRNTLDFFTDSKGNLKLEFEVDTQLSHPAISPEQLKEIMLKAAAKNLSNQSPDELIQKVSDNVEQFKAIGKTLKNIFGGKD